MTVWTAHQYAVIDVEGNGHQPPDLVELAIVSIDAGHIGDPVAWLVRQHQPITPIARRIHRITDVMVADAPPFIEVEAAIRGHLDGSVVVAHNASADLGVLRRKMPDFTPTAVFDTLKLSRRLLPDQPTHRLGALAEALHLIDGLPPGLTPHRASYDALVAARLFVYLATKPDGTPRSFDDLHNEPRRGDETLF